MKKTFLLQEVIDDLVNTDKSLSAPLMKLNYFGRLIKNQDLIDYTQNELNGYRDKETIPDYRRTIGTLYIDLQTYYNQHSRQLPFSLIEEPYRQAFKYVYVREGIAAIEKIARENEKSDSGGQIVTPLPMEMLHILQEPARKLYQADVRIDVVGAKLAGNASIVVEIPNAIRTKLLDFVMSISDTFGYDIEIDSFNKKAETNNQTIIHQMNTTINNSGDGKLINTGNENKIDSNVALYKGDIARLQKELRDQGIDEADIAEISKIVISEKPNEEKAILGEKSNGWISKVINKSLNGVGKIATGISSNLIATLIKQYYGM
ncbi:hypothetical protein L0U88_20580 [Flavihumibacter sp. RY-1]|uniref:AbiTii domain-containing protein n=1 Tax=Flavihumibacter fluminis TaxID=2909236 RepID=A0ABS9BMU4_9BACT|nr:hypothetical protein [Flavihumibacter fluminis]MCF1717051.1 hypothetical protein [Flavihumibacter fluminis]